MKLSLVIKLIGNIKIYCDNFQWVLEVGGVNNRSYYTTLDELCDDLLEVRIIEKSRNAGLLNSIGELTEIVRDARESVRNDIEALENLMMKADSAKEKGYFSKGIH